MPAAPGRSAPKASACAAPSTCSWRRIASRRCGAMIMAGGSRARAALDGAAPAAAVRLRGAVRGDGGPPVTDPPARPAAARVPPEPDRAARRAREARERDPDRSPSSSGRSSACRSSPRPTRCSAPAAAASASSTPRSTRCRSRRSCAPRRPPASAAGSRRMEVMMPLVNYERELALMRELVDRVAAGRDARGRGYDRDDDRAAAGVRCGRGSSRATPTSSRSAPTTSHRRRSASPATTSRARSSALHRRAAS